MACSSRTAQVCTDPVPSHSPAWGAHSCPSELTVGTEVAHGSRLGAGGVTKWLKEALLTEARAFGVFALTKDNKKQTAVPMSVWTGCPRASPPKPMSPSQPSLRYGEKPLGRKFIWNRSCHNLIYKKIYPHLCAHLDRVELESPASTLSQVPESFASTLDHILSTEKDTPSVTLCCLPQDCSLCQEMGAV